VSAEASAKADPDCPSVLSSRPSNASAPRSFAASLLGLLERPWLAGAWLVVLGTSAYFNSFRGQFLFDDLASLVDNPALQHFSTALLPPADGGLTLSGRPLLALSFAFNRAISGVEPWSYHLVNLAIHLANGLLLAAILRRTFRLPVLAPRWAPDAPVVAFIAAAWWLVHPLQTESVTYVVQRAESLVALCYLTTWFGLIRAHEEPARRAWPLVAFVACLAGMATKEVMATAPLVLALYDRLFLAGSWRAVWAQRGRLHLALAATWLLLGALVLSTAGRGGTAGFGSAVSVHDYALTQFAAIAHYLRLFLWPYPLVLDYGTPLVTDGARVLPAAILVLGFATVSVWAAWRGRVWGFAGIFFFVVLAPSSSVVPVATQTMAEHRTYLPLAGLCVLGAAAGVAWLRGRVWLLAAPLLLALGVATWWRNDLYASRTAMYEQIVARRPGNARAMALLGDYYLREGNVAAAQRWLERSVALEPVPEALNNLGNVQQARGDFAAARALFERALAVRPADATTLSNLGNAFAAEGRVDDAIARFEAALQVRPGFPGALFNLANTFAQASRFADAAARYEQLLALTPDDA